MSSSIVLLALIGTSIALDYAPVLKEYGSYGYDHQPSYYGFHSGNKYSYAPHGGYGHNVPTYDHYVPQYGYNGHKYGVPTYGYSKYGYGTPANGYDHPANFGTYKGPHYSSPIPNGFPKGYGSYGKYEAPEYGHPAY